MIKEDVLRIYYIDGAKKLHGMVERILTRFGGIYDKDMDDFYSIANEVMAHINQTYDDSKNLDTYVYACLTNKIKSEITRRNREKRRADREAVSIDASIGEQENSTIGDLLVSSFDIEKEIYEELGISQIERLQRYMELLSERQRGIANLIMEGYKPSEIKQELHITQKEYNSAMTVMKSYEKAKHLCRDTKGYKMQKGDNVDMETRITTSEKTKDTHCSVEAISKRMRKHLLRDDHVLQRSSGQWSHLSKSELISDILQGKSLTQIIVSEEIRDGVTMHWLIDGKQRCTNIDEFLHDGFAISKNVQRYEIEYQSIQQDEDGYTIENEEGFAIPVNKMCDIRKKKFSQLPEELQDRFREYQVPMMLNLNCNKDEIAYDISRFNRCRPMSVAQNGWTGLDEEYAELVDRILKLPFFLEEYAYTSYRNSNNRSGMMRRMVVEGIMTVNYIEEFTKDFRKMCGYLSENAEKLVFDEFYTMVERLNEIADENFVKVFNVKDSFLWFGLFSRFEKAGFADAEFAWFVKMFNKSLHSRMIEGVSFDVLSESATKDKGIVIKKMNHLEELIRRYMKKQA